MSLISGKLDTDEIKERLAVAGVSLSNDKWIILMDMFWRMDAYNSFISIPEVLEILISFIQKNNDIPKSRSEFFEYYLEKVVSSSELVEKIQKVAVVMELLQANEIPTNEFSDLLRKADVVDEEKSNLLTNKVIEDRLDEKNNTVLTGFIHHTLQEYLAAKDILEKNDSIKYLEKLVIINQEKITAIKPSWYGVLRFLCESKDSVTYIQWLLDLGEKNPDIIDDGFSNAITETSITDDKKLSERIFDLIYNTYQQRIIWLPHESRPGLAKFCSEKHLKQFREEINKGKNNTERIVKSGNVGTIVDHLLELKSPLMTNGEKSFWKERFIEWVMESDENGVLTRTSLGALEHYHDQSLVEKFAPVVSTKDSLVSDVFIKFCSEVAPNDEKTIEVLVDRIKRGNSIYGRHGLYKIDSKAGTGKLLDLMGSDWDFMKKFLHDETIFNDRGREQDKAIIDVINKFSDTETISKIKKVLKNTFQKSDYYDPERSYFLKQLAIIVAKIESGYIFEVLGDIKTSSVEDKWSMLCNYQELFGWIVKPNKKELTRFFEEIKEIDGGNPRIAQWAVNRAGDKVLNKAIELGLVEEMVNQKAKNVSARAAILNEIENPTYKEFLRLLEPNPGKYFPLVFEYYNNNKKNIEEFITKESKERLKKLVIDEGLNRIDPKLIKVTIPDRAVRKYNISSIAQYYGEVLRAAANLGINLTPFKQNLINFIPFAYSDDRVTISELIDSISDKDLEWVNSIYLDDKNDIRYLLPDSYVYFVKVYSEKGNKLSSPGKVLKSFVDDEAIGSYDRQYALKTYQQFLTEDEETKKYLEKIFESKIKSDVVEEKRLGEVANSILITKFGDETAINWRFEEVKRLKVKAKTYKPPTMGEAHQVGDFENELDDLVFAGPLTNLSDPKYMDKFLDLLDFSFELLKENKSQFWPYVNYLWRLVLAYVDRLKVHGSFESLNTITEYSKKFEDIDGSSWFFDKINKEFGIYRSFIGDNEDISGILFAIWGHQ